MHTDSRTRMPGVRAREVWAWAMLDFANSGYTTVVITAVFSAYFVGVVAQQATWATLAWTATLSCSYLCVMLSLPWLTELADAYAGKRRLLFFSLAGCVVTTALLARAGPGDLWIAVIAMVLSNYFFSVSESAIAAFLPELARQESLGRISGLGWGLGYVGGLFALAIALWIVTRAEVRGLGAEESVPIVMLSTAVIVALATIPAWFLLKERTAPQTARVHAANKRGVLVGMQYALNTFSELGSDFPEFRRLLFCIVCYQAGIAVVITLAAIYAEQVMGFTMTQTIVLIVAVNLTAALGALLFGFVQDWLGHQRALAVALVGWLITALTAYLAVRTEIFWCAACLAGVCMGSTQSAGRAMVGAFAPAHRLARFYGLWSFSTQLAAVFGPLTYGLVTWLTGGNQRLAMLSTCVFFIMALFLLKNISWEKGSKQRLDAMLHAADE